MINIIIYLLVLLGAENGWCDTTEMKDKIIKDIMTNYNKDVRPVGSVHESGILVGLSIVPLHVHVNSEDATLSSHVWFVMSWIDSRLQWVPANYDNVSVVHLPNDKIWVPDIKVYNSVQHFEYEDVSAAVFFTGRIYWFPPTNLHTNCEIDFTYWPWDVQKCELSVGSWSKTGWEIDLSTLRGGNVSKVSLENFVAAGWEIVSGVQKRVVLPEYGDHIVEFKVELVLKRRSILDRKVAVLPLLVACCLILATFWMHPASSNRLRLNLAANAILVGTLLALRSFLPSAGGQIPMIVVMGTSLVVLCICQLAIILSLYNLVSRTDAPSPVYLNPLQTIAPFLCLGNIPLVGQVPASVTPPWTQGQGDTEALQPVDIPKLKGWNLIAQAIDRLSFVLYSCIIFIFLVSYIGAASNAFNEKMQIPDDIPE